MTREQREAELTASMQQGAQYIFSEYTRVCGPPQVGMLASRMIQQILDKEYPKDGPPKE